MKKWMHVLAYGLGVGLSWHAAGFELSAQQQSALGLQTQTAQAVNGYPVGHYFGRVEAMPARNHLLVAPMDGRVTWRALPPNKRFEQGEILGWFTSSELLSLTRQLTKTSLESEAGSLLAQRLQNLGFSQTAIRAIAKGQSPATDKLTLHMPQTGRLNEWLVASDEVLRQNQPLLAWEKDAGVHLNVSVPVNAAMALQLGQRVQVEGVDAPLAIDFMGEEVSPYSQSLEMGVLLPNEVETLRIGQLVAVDVLKEQPAYRIAQTAVVEVEGKPQVYAINGSQVEPVVVELLARDGESAWVAPMQAGVGLKQLVTRGTALLKAYQMGE